MSWLRRFLEPLGAIKLDATSRLVRMGRDFYRYEEGGRTTARPPTWPTTPRAASPTTAP
jgi:hypothetical protein